MNSSARRRDNAPKITSEKHYACYAIETSQRMIRRLRFHLAGGQIISMPYGYMPLVMYEPGGALTLKTGSMRITIDGRGLNILEGHISQERVIWIRVHPASSDTNEETVFVTSIEAEGELID